MFKSDRGHGLWFAMNADGSNVRALKAPFDKTREVAWSPDATHIAFWDYEMPLTIMRSDGTQRVQITSDVHAFAWSPDSTLFAYEPLDGDRVYFVRSDGTRAGSLPLARNTGFEAWAGSDRVMLITAGTLSVVDRVTGKARALPGDVADRPGHEWSPAGREFAYDSSQGTLCIVDADLTGHRCVKPHKSVVSVAWSPRGDRVAFSSYPGLWVVDPTTMAAREVVHDVGPGSYASGLAWSPDATQIAFVVERDIGVVRIDGTAHTIVSPGEESEPRWIPAAQLARFEGPKLASIGPPFVVTPAGLEVNGVVAELAADGDRVAVLTGDTPDHCDHVVIWKPGTKALRKFGGPEGECQFDWSGLALAGDLAAWISEGGGNFTEAFIGTSGRISLGPELVSRSSGSGEGDYIGHLVGDGNLIAWNEWSQPGESPAIANQTLYARYQRREKLVRGGPVGFPAIAADSGRILVFHDDGSLVVLDVRGKVLRAVRTRAGISGAALGADDLVTIYGTTLVETSVTTGTIIRSWKVPPKSRLTDVQSGLAVYTTGRLITVLDLRTGKSFVVRPKTDRPVLAQIEPAGLFYAYQIDEESFVRLLPMAEIRGRLGT